MKKQYKPSIIKNLKITTKVVFFFCGAPLKGYVAFLDFVTEIKKNHFWNIK